MYVVLRYASLRRLQVALGLALMALAVAPSASGAAQLDTVTATGASSALYSNVNIRAQSGPAGQSPTGTVSLTITMRGTIQVSGPVTSLSVTGPDSGAGTSSEPTQALIGVQTSQFGVVGVLLVDHGGHGQDTICVNSELPPRCSLIPTPPGSLTDRLTNGRAVVFDAPLLPTSTAQCKNGGWRNFGTTFKNQGQCVAFVRQQARQKCLTERAKIGLLAFRDKYGLGRYHVRALRRCISQASR
jgi:hypothetical protein